MNNTNMISEGFNLVSLSDMVMLIKHYPNFIYADGPVKKDGHAVAGYVEDRGVAIEHDPVSGYTSTSFYKFMDNEWKTIATIYTDMSGARDINEVFDAFVNRSSFRDSNLNKVSGVDLINLANSVKAQSVTVEDLKDIKSKVFDNAPQEEAKQTPRERMERESFEVTPSLESESFRNLDKPERSSFRM